MEIIKDVGDLYVIRLYANTINDEDGLSHYYGNIYGSKEDVLEDYPNAVIMKGYGIVSKATHLSPDCAPDWFETVFDAIRYCEELKAVGDDIPF